MDPNNPFARIVAQARKELTQTARDRLALALALLLPLLLLALLGTAISLTVTDLPIVVQDLDQSRLSRAYVDMFRNSLTFRVAPLPPDRSPETALIANEAKAAIIIPEHFERDVQRGRATEVQALVDATDTNTATLIRGAMGVVTQAFTAQNLAAPGARPAVRAETRLWYNPGRIAKRFYGPGIFVLGLSIFPPLLAALGMSREGEQKTILQVYVSSISAHEFLLGKVLAGMIVGVAQILLMMIEGFFLFGLTFVADPTPFLVASVLYLFCVVSFGVLAGSAIPNQAAAIQAVSLGGFILSFLLSGLIFPIQNIPDGLRWISNFVQARYYIDVVRDAFLRGGGWPAVWPSVVMIGVIGAVFYTLAWVRMRRMQVDA